MLNLWTKKNDNVKSITKINKVKSNIIYAPVFNNLNILEILHLISSLQEYLKMFSKSFMSNSYMRAINIHIFIFTYTISLLKHTVYTDIDHAECAQ